MDKKKDWSVDVILDRETLKKDIVKLIDILSRTRCKIVVPGVDKSEAIANARAHAENTLGIDDRYIKNMIPREIA